jgi:uncharacterized membrane protein YjgN (DUF898 family)
MMPSPWSGRTAGAPLAFERQTDKLVGLGFSNFLLTIVTLGIWRFWGRVKVRREIWSRTTLFEDRLEYTGTGGELFRGFLKGLTVFLPLVLLPTVVELMGAEPMVADLTAMVGVGVAGALILYATYAARRYLASRTTWRGVRFVLDGKPGSYMTSQLGWALLLMPTIGLAYPWLRAAQSQWFIGKLHLGNQPFAFDGRGRQIFWVWVAALVANFAFASLAVLLLATASDVNWDELYSRPGKEIVFIQLLPLVLILSFFFGPGRYWFQAHAMRWQAAHTSLAGVRFAMPGATTLRVARLVIGNFLLRVLTLGVLTPLAMARTFGFHARHLQVDGMPDLTRAMQAPGGPRTGEGLEALLGGDGFAV